MIRGLLLALMVLPGSVLACACCAEKGARFEEHINLGVTQIEEFRRIRAKDPATLYKTACGFDCVHGVVSPRDRYPVQITYAEADLNFVMDGHGAIHFGMPETMMHFGVDMAPGDPAHGPEMYTELRMFGQAEGTGGFAGTGDAAFVVSGPGNMCPQAEAFEYWSLTVTSDEGVYRLFGSLTLR